MQVLRSRSALLWLLVLALPARSALAGDDVPPVRLQGSTTFAGEFLAPFGPALEQKAAARLDVVANKSSWGIIALLEGRADLAMISAPLETEIAGARKIRPGLAYETLRGFEIARTRIAFAVNPANPVDHLPLAAVARILSGAITSWKDFGGPDLPILVVAVKEGGGTVAAARAALIGDVPLPASAVRLESAKHVIKVVAQEPAAIGITQLGLVKNSPLHEITTESNVDQPLSFVTVGEPTAQVLRLIETARTLGQHDDN